MGEERDLKVMLEVFWSNEVTSEPSAVMTRTSTSLYSGPLRNSRKAPNPNSKNLRKIKSRSDSILRLMFRGGAE
jgi:hypothetical protein